MATPRCALPFLLLGLVAAARAQDAAPTPPNWPPHEVLRRLAEPAPRDIAWGGFLVRRERLREAVPALRRALARLQGHDDEEGQLARLQLLDALIGLDVRLPGEELLPHAIGTLRVPALVLAGKCPEANSTYFRTRLGALDGSPDLEWRVCGNLLAAQRDPRFVGDCLDRIVFTVAITLQDGNRQQGAFG